ncbi:hypothetical protein FRB94_003021 [Tulasnella sp. JGI-2019a]|nr:hypothetical protein FRB94_003021 [Tulasnella sp. JGI-2019a]KAG9010553.1 hypothetical protein FRB93_003821 [Tulasnella sp. JGI-2019a]KAG9023040.1 hypothetical protein FRB95_013802 [Tulasnella sp. JGI-2019a]
MSTDKALPVRADVDTNRSKATGDITQSHLRSPAVKSHDWRYARRSDLESSADGWIIPGNSSDFKVIRVTWWKKRRGLKHEYIVLKTKKQQRGEEPAERLYISIGRVKAESSSAAEDEIRIAYHQKELTRKSFCFAKFNVRDSSLQSDTSYYTLASLGLLLDEAFQDAPRYRLPTLNCYWLAEICFECILTHYGAERISDPTCLLTGDSEEDRFTPWRLGRPWLGGSIGQEKRQRVSYEQLLLVCQTRAAPFLLAGMMALPNVLLL